jgi:heavy metal translocating P-type ATPase
MTRTASEPLQRGPRALGWVALPEVRWAAAATALFAIGGALQSSGAPVWAWWTAYLACYATGGWEPGWAGLQALRRGTLDVDLLMVVAAIVAAGIGQVLDGGLLIVIFATSGALEALATKRTRDSVTALLTLAPEQASIVRGAGEEVVAADLLVAGDVIAVRPGERIGADGDVLDGASDVDQSSITGEPMPALKTTGSPVYAGTINGTGFLRIQVSRPAHESVVARIVAMVEEASATKAQTQLFIERIEQRYSIGMVAATVALLLIPLAAGAELESTLLRAITFMIVASPCAVVLATMPPLLSAIANAGRHGALLKSAVVLEQLGLTDTVAFDKTGTLTMGAPHVVAIDLLPGTDLSDTAALRIAAAAELPSEHPIAAAILAAAHRRGILDIPRAEAFSATPGRGVQATVEGRNVAVLAPAAFRDLRNDHAPDIEALISSAESAARTAVVLIIDGAPVAVISTEDQTRPDAAAAVLAIKAATAHPPILITGDNLLAARLLGAQLGIDDVRAQLLPADKAGAIAGLQSEGRRVLVVGDGVNDAPALAAAHIGIAMGRTGSDLALQTADGIIVRDDLATVAAVISLSRRARRVVVANLAIAGIVICSLVAWDLIGTLPLPLGVAGHEGSTVVVGLNGLRLLRGAVWGQCAALPIETTRP